MVLRDVARSLDVMNCWLYITNSDNWVVTKKTNILGASQRFRNSLSRLKLRDKCLVYVISNLKENTPARIVAEYSVASNVFIDSTEIFKAPIKAPSETFSVRIKLKAINIFKEPVDFKPLVSKLAFIGNKQNYALHIRGRAVVQIPEEDYKLITAKTALGSR